MSWPTERLFNVHPLHYAFLQAPQRSRLHLTMLWSGVQFLNLRLHFEEPIFSTICMRVSKEAVFLNFRAYHVSQVQRVHQQWLL